MRSHWKSPKGARHPLALPIAADHGVIWPLTPARRIKLEQRRRNAEDLAKVRRWAAGDWVTR